MRETMGIFFLISLCSGCRDYETAYVSNKKINRQTKPLEQLSGLGLADLAFAVEDLGNDALRSEISRFREKDHYSVPLKRESFVAK